MTLRRFGILTVVIAVVVLGSILQSVLAQPNTDESRYIGTVEAPEFPELDWLNVDAPLTIDGLRGKIVLLDFWTYGCINCIHMIPVLRQLEERFPDELVVIGVHSAKFSNESETENIRQIVQRYDLHHPVINDIGRGVMRLFRANAWPYFIIIDPRGNVVAAQSGEVPYEAFEQYISGMIEFYDNLGEDDIDRTPLALALEGAGNPGTPLLFPGKVLVDEAGSRLFIADSNHHRIVIADLNTYEVLATIGDGYRGFMDGSYAEAEFDQPQGMELIGDTLYIADVNNHAIRAVDLVNETVTTIAGNGQMGRGVPSVTTVIDDPTDFAIRSPWDVELGDNNILYIAMAGTHQIWQLNLETNQLQAAVGNGREAQLSTGLLTSELAQPSGLYYDEGRLYFADSESSTVRVADMFNDAVEVIAGTINNSLFDYGDADGIPGESLLQHALGVTGDGTGNIYIADTYNSKIKLYDRATDEIRTIFGLSGNGGFRDGAADIAQFDEPGGLDYANGLLYVADTNNHAIRIIDLASGEVSTMTFPNPEALVIARNDVVILGGNAADGVVVTLDQQTVAAGEGIITLTLDIPAGFKINPLINSVIDLSSSDSAVSFSDARVTIADGVVTIPASFSDGQANATLDVTLYYCEAEEEAFCLIDEAQIIVPVTVGDGGEGAIGIDYDVILPEEFAADF